MRPAWKATWCGLSASGLPWLCLWIRVTSQQLLPRRAKQMDHYDVWLYDELALWSKAGRRWNCSSPPRKSSHLPLESQAFGPFTPNWRKHDKLYMSKKNSKQLWIYNLMRTRFLMYKLPKDRQNKQLIWVTGEIHLFDRNERNHHFKDGNNAWNMGVI